MSFFKNNIFFICIVTIMLYISGHIVYAAPDKIYTFDHYITAKLLDINGDLCLTKEEYDKNKNSLIEHPAFAESMEFFENNFYFALRASSTTDEGETGILYDVFPSNDKSKSTSLGSSYLKYKVFEKLIQDYYREYAKEADGRLFASVTNQYLSDLLDELYSDVSPSDFTDEMVTDVVDTYLNRYHALDLFERMRGRGYIFKKYDMVKKFFYELDKSDKRKYISEYGGDPENPVYYSTQKMVTNDKGRQQKLWLTEDGTEVLEYALANVSESGVSTSAGTKSAVSDNTSSGTSESSTNTFDPTCQASSNIDVATDDYTKEIGKYELEAIARFFDANGDGTTTRQEYDAGKNTLLNHNGLKAAMGFFENNFDLLSRCSTAKSGGEGLNYSDFPLVGSVIKKSDMPLATIEGVINKQYYDYYRENKSSKVLTSYSKVDSDKLLELIKELYPEYETLELTEEMIADVMEKYLAKYKEFDIFTAIRKSKYRYEEYGEEAVYFYELSKADRKKTISKYGGDSSNPIYYSTPKMVTNDKGKQVEDWYMEDGTPTYPDGIVDNTSNDPAIPVTNDPTTPVVNDPTTPVTNDPVTPVTNDPATPVTNDPTPPVVSDPTTSVTNDPTTPVSNDPDIVTANDPASTVDISIPDISVTDKIVTSTDPTDKPGTNVDISIPTPVNTDSTVTSNTPDPLNTALDDVGSDKIDSNNLTLGTDASGKPIIVDSTGKDILQNADSKTLEMIAEKAPEFFKDPKVLAAIKKNSTYFYNTFKQMKQFGVKLPTRAFVLARQGRFSVGLKLKQMSLLLRAKTRRNRAGTR